MTNRVGKRPVTIVTGFLGSGKTTLLTRLLGRPEMRTTGTIVNEFGKVSLDHHLLRRVDEQTVLVGGGCLCCGMRGDLVKALMELLDTDQRGLSRVDRVVIETTGLADPAPIVFTIVADPILQHHFYVDRVITTVDAVNGQLHMDRDPESSKQVAVADVIVVTKSDIAPPETVSALIQRLHLLNPSASVQEATCGEGDPTLLFSSERAEDLADVLGDQQQGLRSKVLPASPSPHLSDIRSISIMFDQPLDWTAFGVWFSMLLYARGEAILRVKGMVNVGEAGPVVLNGVQHIIHPPQHLEVWPTEDHRSRIMFIMKSLDPNEVLQSLLAFQQFLGVRVTMGEVEVLT